MKKRLKHISLMAIVILPNVLKIFIYNKFFGWDIDKTAKIGLSFIDAKKVKIGAHAKIGHLNVIRNLELFEIGESSTIGNLNSINALPLNSKKHFKHETDRVQSFILGNHSDVVTKHYFDCNNAITIGDKTIIAGIGCAFFTHSINVENNRQETAPITIGDYCMVGAKSVITRGAVLPNNCILAANSTLHKPQDETHMLYSGVPAEPVKTLDKASKFFHRDTGFVD